jgi:hypothetical protein
MIWQPCHFENGFHPRKAMVYFIGRVRKNYPNQPWAEMGKNLSIFREQMRLPYPYWQGGGNSHDFSLPEHLTENLPRQNSCPGAQFPGQGIS